MTLEKRTWLRLALQFKGSVIPAVLPRTILCGSFGLFITYIHYNYYSLSLPVLSALIPNIVLGLLLVFRTNTAYDRFWEGRKCWGGIVNTSRNLARQIWTSVEEETEQDRTEKISALKLIIGFAVTTKNHLRGQFREEELVGLLPDSRLGKLENMNNPPLEVAFWLSDYLQKQYEQECLNSYQLVAMQRLVDTLVEMLGGCERILRTPMPLAYAIHLKQLLLLYSLSLPFQMVKDVGWWTAPVVALISFTLFGIEEIGIEIENPFGYDANDLPLDNICLNMRRNIEDLISLSPTVRQLAESAAESSPLSEMDFS